MSVYKCEMCGAVLEVHGYETVVVCEYCGTKQTVSELDDEQKASIASLLRRVFMFLEDGDWESADEYCERVLDMEPENAQAWLGKLLAEMKVRKLSYLVMCEKPFQNSINYQKLMRFGDEELKAELEDCISTIREKQMEQIYAAAVQKMNFTNRPEEFVAAAQAFKSIGDYKDSAALAESCIEKAKLCQKNVTYYSAKEKKRRKRYKEAAELFESIPGWQDADEQASVCRQEAEKKVKRKIRRRIFAVVVFCAAAVFFVVYFQVIVPNSKYDYAAKLMRAERYEIAVGEFLALDGYKDSEKQIENCYIEKYGEEAYSKVKDIRIGDIYDFGLYEQDGSAANGRETIEWIVLDKQGAALLLVSRYVLRDEFYNWPMRVEEWENCSLREELNDGFLYGAFSSEEQDKIIRVPLKNGFGNSITEDRVFLLSVKEAKKYFASDTERVGKDVYYKEGEYAGFIRSSWWLRKSGKNIVSLAIVNESGNIQKNGGDFEDSAGIRPAMWILPMP